jgi:leukotriene B4 12-hydroxydehydrogenase/15-oxo-prostaglandin 13-reductase
MNAALPDHSDAAPAPTFHFRFWHNAPMSAKSSAKSIRGYPMVNRQFTLAARPVGMPKESDFQLVESPVPPLSEGQILLRTLFWSVDPYMRSRMNGIKTYADPVNIGQVMVGGTVSQVVDSKNPNFQVGDVFEAYGGWREYSVSKGEKLRKLDPQSAPVSTALGILGMPGMTAYFGLVDICKPQPGETVVVSGAAGAVGSLVGQIAKIIGCRAIGIAGSDEKVSWLVNELGFDAAFNYKTAENYVLTLKELCPAGIDCYFDNVGGEISDAVFPLLNPHGRISVCGQISQYNTQTRDPGLRILIYLLSKQARAEGFLVYQFADRYPEGIAQMARWIKDGKLKYREQIVEGFENTPAAFIGMLKGENMGKMLVKVADAV